MQLKLQRGLGQRLNGMFGKYNFEVGVLNDGPHKDAKQGVNDVSSYAGGPVRKTASSSSQTIAEVSRANSERLGFNYLSAPFKDRTSDVVRFTDSFFKLVFGRSTVKRAENLLQAIVRNPILRGEYGPQGPFTTAVKGFDRPMIDTAQLFKAIRAKCKVVKRV